MCPLPLLAGEGKESFGSLIRHIFFMQPTLPLPGLGRAPGALRLCRLPDPPSPFGLWRTPSPGIAEACPP